MYIGVLPACLFEHHMCVVYVKAREECWISWDWSYRQLLDTDIGNGIWTQVLS